MRIAVCSADMDERHALSKMVETGLIRRGILPEVVLLPMQQELVEASVCRGKTFDLVLVAGTWDLAAMQEICRCVPVIMVGGKNEGPIAFTAGARYYIESPASQEAIGKALTRCIDGNKKEEVL